MITILTPTYNRKILLQRLAESLMSQTTHDFEWLVIDDGSIDGTGNLINLLKEKTPFPVRYIYKENGGKHTALNIGFDEAKGDWVFIVDSDDWLERDCINKINALINEVGNEVGSISILKQFENGSVIGECFPDSIKTYIDRIDQEVAGDKADIFRKSALDGFRFPVYEGENFMAESPLFIWLGLNYKTYFKNFPGYICEYQESGLSDNSIKNRHRCYRSAMYVYEMQYMNLRSRRNKFKAAVNWWRFSYGKKTHRGSVRIPYSYSIFGFLLTMKDFFKYGYIEKNDKIRNA